MSMDTASTPSEPTALPRKIRWVVSGVAGDRANGWASPLASNRYRAILPAEALLRAGHDVDLIAAETWRWQQADQDAVFVIGKLLPGHDLAKYRDLSRSVLEQAARAVDAGVRVVADFNDDHFEHPTQQAYWRGLAQTAVVCTVGSQAMDEVLRPHTRAPSFVVGDPIGSPRGEPKVFERESGLSKWSRSLISRGNVSRLKFVWYGHPSNWPAMELWAQQLAPLASEQPWLLWIVTQPTDRINRAVDAFNERYARAAIAEVVPWDEETQWHVVADADVVLLPSDLADPRKVVKTSNRLVDALHSGRYVIASPLPAYEAFRESAVLTDDPLASVRAYLADPRAAIGRIRRGQAEVQITHGADAMATAWMRALVDPLPVSDLVESPGSLPAAVPRELIRLNLGCGAKILPGFINVDLKGNWSGKEPDVVADVTGPLPFGSGFADEVHAYHVLEHLVRWDVENCLREWTRVLKPGGQLVLEMPCLDKVVMLFKHYLESGEPPNPRLTLWALYGDPGYKVEAMLHRWCYSVAELKGLLLQAGLTDVREEVPQTHVQIRDMRIVATKGDDVPQV